MVKPGTRFLTLIGWLALASSMAPSPSTRARCSSLLKPLRLRGGGYTLGIRDSIMIAHSFRGAEFGPAQRMHGATYTVDMELSVDELTPRLNWVIDIGAATTMLKEVLSKYNYRNLDEMFGEANSTTEFMCKEIFDQLKERLKGGIKGSLTIKLHESHIAWASYTEKI